MSSGFPAPENDRQRMAELVEYVHGEIVSRGDHGTPKIEVHYHAAPVVIDTTPVEPNAGDRVLAKYTPYFIVLLGGAVILAIVGVVTVLLVPVLMAMVTMIAVVMLGFAVAMIAVAGSVKSLRQSASDRDVVKQAVRTGRKRR
jgi:choline-glycine betaine transporter